MTAASTTTHPPRRGRPGKVDRERILAKAREMDPATLTMQDVASGLGVSTPALYHYFRNKDELLTALAHDHLQGVTILPRNGRPWQEWMRDACLAIYDVLATSPEVTKHTRIAEPTDTQVQLMDEVLGILLDAGFTPENARRVYDLMLRYLFRAALQTDSNIGRVVKMRPDLLDDHDGLPALSRVIAAGTPEENPRDSFAVEVDCLIGGISRCFAP